MALYWQVSGQGQDLVLVHGWGMNGAVWQSTAQALSRHFRVHVVDLPGYGHSAALNTENIEQIAAALLLEAPRDAIWVGWSLGGLVATHIALHHPAYVRQLVTVASSPKFAAHQDWRGIQPAVLQAFSQQLLSDFPSTIERFMALQAMGSPTARQDVKQLKQAVLSRPMPNPLALMAGLTMLAELDLRAELAQLTQPVLRLYGRLDGLVPVNIAHDVDLLLPQSAAVIFNQSAHAPFITEAELFEQQLLTFAALTKN